MSLKSWKAFPFDAAEIEHEVKKWHLKLSLRAKYAILGVDNL